MAWTTATSMRCSPRDKPVMFAYHGYPSLIHRLTYRRTNHGNFHVHGYKEEGTTTTPFDMTVMNEIDRFHLVKDVIDARARASAQRANVVRTHATTNWWSIATTSGPMARTCRKSATGSGAGRLSRRRGIDRGTIFGTMGH